MRPRYEPRDPEFDALLKEAIELESIISKEQGILFDQKEGTAEGHPQFQRVLGGGDTAQSSYYNTNGRLLDVEDVTNKGAISETSDVLDKNPYFPTAVSTLAGHLVDGGGEIQKSLVGADYHSYTLSELKKAVTQLKNRL